jgi:hypothetical protein
LASAEACHSRLIADRGLQDCGFDFLLGNLPRRTYHSGVL